MSTVDKDDAGTPAPTVFVVDDDPSVRRSLARLVRAAGWRVETFASGCEFLERPVYTGVGCVVLDVKMPGMTGPEVHAEMALLGIRLPVVFLTGHGDVGIGVTAMKHGAVDFLGKPVDDQLLLQTLQEAVQRHAAVRGEQLRLEDVSARLARLSPREREVCQFVIGGHLNKQIADRMGISLKTVKAHRARVMEKMEVVSVAALVHLCEVAREPSVQRGGGRPEVASPRPPRPSR